ncbi:hypothetical protein [Alteromonas gilva]|uniref:CPBP family intramembrane metalloprotease n=1 Tax=Alteromonas gilva TaxID=2987522 RepID=A0ABT5L2U6_9ALTE|nr:hypothetical protein [Alteromonas gilva]MDC8831357.1 hypothetical protein [Alteromonas gilva]
MDKNSYSLMFPFDFLSNTSQSKVIYLLSTIAISTIPALSISFLIYVFFPEAESPEFPKGIGELFFSVVIFAPVVETLLLWLGISIIKKFTASIWKATLISALLWAIIHSIGTFTHGFAIFWSFVVFSFVFISWLEKSRNLALGMCMATHMGQNFLVFLLMQIP